MKNLPYDRAGRVGQQIKDLMLELRVSKLNDPRLKEIEITDVILTRDLRIARIYFYTENGRNAATAGYSALKSAKGAIKREISTTLNMKYTPELEFYFDESIGRGQKIEKLLSELNLPKEE
ncbi:30S ribosome-binding factor RbfA [bacterium]|nr:30S ribosome-binding factor RbfA [bacterium]